MEGTWNWRSKNFRTQGDRSRSHTDEEGQDIEDLCKPS